MNEKNPHIIKGIKTLVGIVFILGVFFAGIYIGYSNLPAVKKITSIINKESSVTADADFAPFWKAWVIADSKFVGGSNKTSNNDRIYGAIKGMMSSFKDPYTTFFNPSETSIFESEISGSFIGIGVEIGQKDGILTVIAPLKDTPAYRAGIKSGDKIIKIESTITNNLSIDKAISLIRGKENTNVELTIFREGFTEPKVFSVSREKIDLPTVKTEIFEDKKVFVIHLYTFSAQSPQNFQKAFQEYLDSGYSNLLLDLRGNPGGYLDAAVSISGLFIPEGKTIVKEIGKNLNDINIHTSRGPNLFPKNSKLIILVDKGSASASEILAGALSEQGIGTLVGEKTFGKGSVQEVIKLTSDTSLKITVAKWYTPKGLSISENGLTPDIIVPHTENKSSKDEQLENALKIFLKK